jgi:hypothetical protein
MSFRFYLFILFAFVVSSGLHAQPVLHLVIQDQSTQPVYDVSVTWRTLGVKAKTMLSSEFTLHPWQNAEGYLLTGAAKGQKITLSVQKEGYKTFTTTIKVTKDTTQVRVLLTRATILLPEVGITTGRLSNEQTKESFNALDYHVDDSVVLILGKSGNKLQLRLYALSLKLRSIGEVPYADLKLLVDCNNTPVLFNKTTALGIELKGDTIQLTRDVPYETISTYISSPCLLKYNSKYFYSHSNPLKTTFIFYSYDPLQEHAQLFFVASNQRLDSEINNFIPNVLRATDKFTPVDPTKIIVPIELSEYLAHDGAGFDPLTRSINRVNDSRVYFKKILLDGNQCHLFFHSNQFHILDIQKLEYHSIDTGYTRCHTGSFTHLAAGGKWSKKFFSDEEYSRLYTTYVQGDTRVVEVKGEKLEETKTVANIPFNGYFPEKLKVRGSYLYYLMFDGKKRILYKEKMEGYE